MPVAPNKMQHRLKSFVDLIDVGHVVELDVAHRRVVKEVSDSLGEVVNTRHLDSVLDKPCSERNRWSIG